MTIRRAAVAAIFLFVSLFQVAHAQTGSVTPMSGSGARTVQIDNQTYLLENHVMRVMNGQLTKVNLPGATGAITPACGAFYNGQKQAECGTQPALFETAAQGTCPAGTFFDIGRWACWKCPAGFTRGGAAVDSDRACERPATAAERKNQAEFQPAAYVGDRCPAGAFYDTIGGGTCWSCPADHNVNVLVHVQAADKCTQPARQVFSGATRYQKTSFAWDCKDGRFWDIWDGGNCWSCPAGYSRNGNHINRGDACDRTISADNKPATQRSGGNCEAGTFPHVNNFGMTNERTVCLKCPEGYDQVILEAGNSPRKCQTTTRLVFAEAIKDSALTCKAGQDFDFIGLTQQDINTRRQFQGQPNKPQPVQSGTCWSCPSGYYRTLAGVKGNDACGSSGIDFYIGVMREPGLFGLGGAAEVLAEILAQDARVPSGTPGMVARAIDAAADAEKIATANRAAYIQEEVRKLALEPQSSGVAAALVFGRLLTALADDSKATAAEKRLVASFTQYIKMKRSFMAQIAGVQYNTWLETTHWRDKNQVGKNVLDRATMSAYGRPPSFEQAALLTAAGGGALGMAASEVVGKVKIPVPLLGEVASLAIGLATGGYQDYTKGVEKALHTGAKTVGEITFGLALTAAVDAAVTAAITSAVTASAMTAAAAGAGFSSVAVASSIAASTALASSGIGLAVGAVLIVASMQLEQLNQFLDAPVKAGALLAQARETSTQDLIRMGKTTGGMGELLAYYSSAIDAGSQMTPAQKTAYDGLVQKHVVLAKATSTQVASAASTSAAASGAVSWMKVTGLANDIAVGANGSVWHIGTDARPGGFGIYRWAGSGWANLQGGAVKIAVDAQGNPWVANDKKEIFRWDGAKWVGVPGLANELAIGGSGVWHIGTDARPGGFGIYRWDGGKWVNVPGGAVKIAVNPQGLAAVVNDRGEIFNFDGRQFNRIPGAAKEIAVGAGGHVWVVGTNPVAGGFDVYRWDGRGWARVDGGLTNIAVMPDGKAVGANAAKEIYRMQ